VSNEIVWRNPFITRNYLVGCILVFDDEIIDRSRLGESRECANSGRRVGVAFFVSRVGSVFPRSFKCYATVANP